MPKNLKIVALISAGNALDYYDFMLFAYLGSRITGFFIPNLNPTQTHLITLLLFAIPFIIRPIGGYFFGKLSDARGRGMALGQTLKFASLASAGIALLPTYEVGGIVSMTLFVLLRALQGFSLGGEYTTAGTLLMEKYATQRSLISGVLGTSGTVGSLIAFCFAWFYLNNHFHEDAWRIAFGVGALVTYGNYFLREKLKKEMFVSEKTKDIQYHVPHRRAILITLFTGMLLSVTIWIPMIYVNFYFTHILHYPASKGLIATLVALVCLIILTPMAGYICDRFFRPERMMTVGALLSPFLCAIGLLLIQQGNIWGQVFITTAAVLFGASAHAVINPLFPPEIRSRYVNTFFMLGGSLGSLIPAFSGYLADHYDFHQGPLVFAVTFGVATSFIFYTSFIAPKRSVQLSVAETTSLS